MGPTLAQYESDATKYSAAHGDTCSYNVPGWARRVQRLLRHAQLRNIVGCQAEVCDERETTKQIPDQGNDSNRLEPLRCCSHIGSRGVEVSRSSVVRNWSFKLAFQAGASKSTCQIPSPLIEWPVRVAEHPGYLPTSLLMPPHNYKLGDPIALARRELAELMRALFDRSEILDRVHLERSRDEFAPEMATHVLSCVGDHRAPGPGDAALVVVELDLSLIHISEPTRQAEISYAVFCLKKKK